ncbi:tetratricopeptide repeat protein, partial [Streptomyces sp. NPDC087850]
AIYQGRYKEAETYLLRAIEASRADGNRPREASALCNLSRLQIFLGRPTEAIAFAQQGLHIYDRIGLPLRLANARYALGVALTHAGRYEEALEQLEEAFTNFGKNRQRLWEGTALFRMAEAHLSARRPARAARHAEQALASGCIGGDRIRAGVLTVLGRSLSALGQTGRAQVCWQEALTLYEECGAREAEDVRGLLTPLSAA